MKKEGKRMDDRHKSQIEKKTAEKFDVIAFLTHKAHDIPRSCQCWNFGSIFELFGPFLSLSAS